MIWGKIMDPSIVILQMLVNIWDFMFHPKLLYWITPLLIIWLVFLVCWFSPMAMKLFEFKKSEDIAFVMFMSFIPHINAILVLFICVDIILALSRAMIDRQNVHIEKLKGIDHG